MKPIYQYTFFIALTLASCVSKKATTDAPFVYSTQVKDSFLLEVYTHLPDDSAPIQSIYMLDAEIDTRTKRLFDSVTHKHPTQNYRVIGIGQTHYSKRLRQRDFVPPADGRFFSHKDKYTGRADLFYQFITESIIPTYDSDAKHRTLIGHSFGGLFGVYASTQDSSPFSQIYALSPSLWINYSAFNSNYKTNHDLGIKTNLTLVYGSREQLNKVAPAILMWKSNIKKEDKSKIEFIEVQEGTHKTILNQMYTFEFWNL